MTCTPTFVSEYLARIGINEASAPTLEQLQRIQYQHVTTIPFENLDIMNGNLPLNLDVDSLFEKIIVHKRGGICYEQNLLLRELLEQLGYHVELMSSMHPKYMVEFDHIFLMVEIDGERWLTDVGFADNSLCPLRFNLDEQWQTDGRTQYRFIQVSSDTYHLVKLLDGKDFVQFIFTLTPRETPECFERCVWYSISPDSRFTKGRLVTLDRPDGRITMVDEYLLETKDGQKVKTDITNRAQFDTFLREHFDIVL